MVVDRFWPKQLPEEDSTAAEVRHRFVHILHGVQLENLHASATIIIVTPYYSSYSTSIVFTIVSSTVFM
jgi:hypothetical protein